MSWLLLAILARLLWAGTNLMDQYMVRYTAQQSGTAVLIIEFLVNLPVIICLICINGVPSMQAGILFWLIVGMLSNLMALIPYFLALKKDDAYNAIPIMELTPVVLTFLAWVVFGDKLNGTQLAGAAMIITGGFLFACDFKHGRFRLRTTLLMVASSVCFALYQLALRYGAQNEAVANVVLVVFAGNFICALLMFVALPRQRALVIQSVRQSRGKILLVGFVEELMAISANICLVAAFAVAPRAGQVSALNASQPVFVLLISFALGFWLPRHYPKLVWDWEMKIKCLLLLVIAGGVILLKTP
jgi:drug/metabolite transporter (DMT)-like permease